MSTDNIAVKKRGGGTGGRVYGVPGFEVEVFYTNDILPALSITLSASNGTISDDWIASRPVSSLNHRFTTRV